MKNVGRDLGITHGRPVLLKGVVGLEVFAAIGGFAGGIAFLLDPSGGLLNTSPSILSGTPINDFFLIGLWLTGIFGIGGLLVSYSVWSGRSYSRSLAYLLGGAASFWIILENVILGPTLLLELADAVFCGPQIAAAILLFRSRKGIA